LLKLLAEFKKCGRIINDLQIYTYLFKTDRNMCVAVL